MSARIAIITSDRYTMFVSHSRMMLLVLLHAVSSHLGSIIAISITNAGMSETYYVAAKATYIRLLHGKIGFLGFFGPSSVKKGSDPYSAWMKYVVCLHLYCHKGRLELTNLR